MRNRLLAALLGLVLCLTLLPMSVFAAGMTGDDHITFSSTSAFSISAAAKGWDGTVQYSTNNSTWTTWDGSEVSAAKSGTAYYLCFRGTGNTKITGDYTYRWELNAAAGVACDGNIMTLLSYSNPGSASMARDCFNSLFRNWIRLTKAPTLPATTLAPYCYNSMFYNCESLTTAPALPATTMAESCYNSMFYGCKNLTAAPNLPAATLAPYCYSQMFLACNSLTTAPALPATTMKDHCYSEMFSACKNLKTAPASLPATSLYQYCYSRMFKGCTSLTTAPALPATTLTRGCYEAMFEDCTGLTSAPALPATTLAIACYSCMFEGCTSLKTTPALNVSSVPMMAYNRMFADCTGLTAVPALPATTLGMGCYQEMFLNCTGINLNTTGSGSTWSIPAGAAADSSWNRDMFKNTSGDLIAPEIGRTYYYSSHVHTYNRSVAAAAYLKSAADCEHAAVYFKSCACGRASISDTFTSGAPLGHSYGAWISISDTQHQRTCANNPSHVDTAEHSFNSSNKCTACGYEKTVATITVTFEANGGTGTMASQTLAIDESWGSVINYYFPACGFTAPSGKIFDHWEWKYTGDEEWNSTTPGSNPYLSRNTTIRAVWKDIPTYTVTFAANGGSGIMPAESAMINSNPFATTYAFPACGFTAPEGKEFDHWEWSLISTESWSWAQPGDTPWISGNIIVKAIWKDGEVANQLGDVNGDGDVDNTDLTDLLRHVAKIELLEDDSHADINDDGNIDAADVTALAKIIEAQNP